MSSLTNTVPFSLDEINLRKKLVFPDGTIQSTAYTGAVGGATLAEVLADGNDATLLSINNLASLEINAIPVVSLSAGEVTVVPLLDVTSIRYPDASDQTSAPRFIETVQSAATVALTTDTSYTVLTTSALPVGSYSISGYIRNTASVAQVTAVQLSFTLNDGVDIYPVGFSTLGTQNVNQVVPYFPIDGVFRCSVAGNAFQLTQFVSFAGGIYTRTAAYINIYYLGP